MKYLAQSILDLSEIFRFAIEVKLGLIFRFGIKEGEELTDCYLDLTLEGRISAEQRKRLLKGGYDFWYISV